MARALDRLPLVLLALCSALVPAAVSAQRIQITASETEITVEQQVMLLVRVTDARGAEPDLPVLEGFEVTPAGQESQVSFVNGRTSSSVAYRFLLTPKRPGTFEVGAATLEVDGTRGVLEINRASGPDDCLLRIDDWDFDWQDGYGFQTPIQFNPGDRMYLECHWDNSPENQVVVDGTEELHRHMPVLAGHPTGISQLQTQGLERLLDRPLDGIGNGDPEEQPHLSLGESVRPIAG